MSLEHEEFTERLFELQEENVLSFNEILAINIVTRQEIAGRLNVHARTMYGWVERRERNNFPEPLRRISGGKAGAPFEIYWWPQVSQWYATYIPRRGPKVNNGARPVTPVGE